MKFLLVHLSDIHIKTDADTILTRSKAIVDAVLPSVDDAHFVLVVTTGDVAYGGEASQYECASSFLAEIRDSLLRARSQSDPAFAVWHVVLPGNHDCDLADVSMVRQIVADSVASDPSKALDNDVISTCTEVQSSFFEFRDAIASAGLRTSSTAPRMVYEYVFGEGAEAVRLVCANTAWISQVHERQGTLYFPPLLLPAVAEETVTIVCFHHPYNWLESNNARAFRKAVEGVADIVLTGHEHDPGSVVQERARGVVNTYIEGGVLQDSNDPSLSAFNVLVIDTVTRKQAITVFRWDGSRYERGEPIRHQDEGPWEDFRPNRARTRNGLLLSERSKQKLDELGVAIHHNAVGTVLLSHVFVCPDLRIMQLGLEKKRATAPIRGDEVFELFSKSTGIHLITGDSQSGKTSLAKMLTMRLWERGDVPILLCGSELSSPQKVEKLLEDTFAKLYDPADREAFRQLSPTRRIVVVDDYHRLRAQPRRKDEILKALERRATRVILIANDVMQGIEALTRPDTSVSLSCYRIQPFGHLRRNSLVERWLCLSHDAAVDTAEFARTLNFITRTLDSLIGTNFVPAYPPYVLAILQATEAATTVDTRASTHGYFYELFIRTSLARGRTGVEYDIMVAYLAHVAFSLFRRRKLFVGTAELRSIHGMYVERHDVAISFEAVQDELVKQQIWTVQDDEFGFRYRYLYYYFCAAYIRDHINQVDARERIVEMAGSLHVEEFANIMLFLAHLSRDPMIIQEMLNAAKRSYKDVVAARLDDDVEFLSDLPSLGALIVSYTDADASSARLKELEALDCTTAPPTAELVEAPPDELDLDDPVVEIEIALKTLQILGQIVKNFPGALEGPLKAEIVGECYGLGLRALGHVYSLVRDNKEQVVRGFADLVVRAHPGFSPERVLDRARLTVTALSALSALGIVKRVSMAVGSPDLEMTYERVEDAQIPAHLLIGLSIQLDHAGRFPMTRLKTITSELRRRALGMWVARALTTQYFRQFPSALATKQRAFQELGIRYEQVEPAFAPFKLLAGT